MVSSAIEEGGFRRESWCVCVFVVLAGLARRF